MKKGLLIVFLIVLVSCKSKAVYMASDTNKKIDAAKIIENHYSNTTDFTTLYIKSSAHYEDNNQSQNVTAEIKIKKNEMLLISIRFLGITMAKALITPTEVKYYEKLGSTYFEGNYGGLSQFLGIDLDFNKVQNLIIGQALDDLKIGKYRIATEENLYKLENDTVAQTKSTYFLEPEHYLIKKEAITQSEKESALRIFYPNHIKYNQLLFPSGVLIEADQRDKKTNISIEYDSVLLNQELSFPYNVPEGYKRIFIN